MPADYLLSVDLGTSHTVAVVIWPDGRTRPLLFDGSPVMPSAVFLDEAGTIHVGRDAERLGPTAPERFEPNPKQRISDGILLLGSREVPVTAAFSAILARVAQQCAEAIGGLPQTVLTCPAAWGERRRAVLHDAAAGAGYPPVQIITEPVAAAHYYTARLANPINPGQALAVFDFGGGTLDIAVVERRRDGSFGVLADGGLPDLGGLDFDAALVAHIGETVRQRDPELWKRIEQPTTATELRDRRTLWNDVRGAKEMLSRSSVAPVAVPGMEQALHLTRGELDQLARPLLSRAVGETQRVLGLTGRRSEELAGLFLVGGSSRMPLVSKVLHEQLGIAPTALEQPELPVSEGAALAVAGPAPVTPPSMSPPAAMSPQATGQQSGSLPPQTPETDGTLQLRMPSKPKRHAKRNRVIAIAAVIAVLAVAAPLLWMYFASPYQQREFIDLEEVGDTIPFASEEHGGIYAVQVRDDKALFAYATDSEEELHLRAVDTRTGESIWDQERVLTGAGWDNALFASGELAAVRQSGEDGQEVTWHFLDWASGDVISEMDKDADGAARSGDHLVTAWTGGNEIAVYDRTGTEVAAWEIGDTEEGVVIDDWGLVGTPDDLIHPASPANGDGRIWAMTSEGMITVYDIETGEASEPRQLESVDDVYFAYGGHMFVAVDDDTGYEINVYDIDDDLKEVDSERVRHEEAISPTGMVPCGETRVCVSQEDAEFAVTHLVYDVDKEEKIHRFDGFEYGVVFAVGDRLLVEEWEGDDLRTQVYDKDFKAVSDSKGETFGGIDGGSAIAYPPTKSFGLSTGGVIGLGVRDGRRYPLRAGLEVYSCRPSDTHLACMIEGGMQIFRFRED